MRVRSFMLSVVFSCFSIYASAIPAEDDKGWIYDEVLTQLHEIRAEIMSLSGELALIKDELRKVTDQRGAVNGVAPDVALNGAYATGSNRASVVIVEFSDYQCPFCKKHHANAYVELKKNYIETGKVKYAVMDFPLSFHSQAKSAAVAARCAGKQGKFWDMQHALFESKKPFGDELYREMASLFKLDAADFNACLQSKSIVDQVNRQMEYGSQLGVQGTPAFFIGKLKGGKVINPRLVSGAQSYNSFSRIIDALLID